MSGKKCIFAEKIINKNGPCIRRHSFSTSHKV